jgi:hypothetical protein
MEYTEKPKHATHDSRLFLVIAGLMTALLWYISIPPLIWLKPPLTEWTPWFNIACVVTPPVVIMIYLGYHGMKPWQKMLMVLFGLAACAGVSWIVFSGMMLGSYGPCESQPDGTQICLRFDPDNAYAYTFASPDYLPFIMVMTGFSGSGWEEHACWLLRRKNCLGG